MSPSPSLRLVTFDEAAAIHGVVKNTVRYWVLRGFVTGYRLPDTRGTFVDLDEVAAHAGSRRAGWGTFGPDAHIVELPAPPAPSSDTTEATR